MRLSIGLPRERIDTPDNDNGVAYQPVTATLMGVDAKPGHVRQLCFYADALAALPGRDPERRHVLFGSGRRETLKVNDFREAPPEEPALRGVRIRPALRRRSGVNWTR